ADPQPSSPAARELKENEGDRAAPGSPANRRNVSGTGIPGAAGVGQGGGQSRASHPPFCCWFFPFWFCWPSSFWFRCPSSFWLFCPSPPLLPFTATARRTPSRPTPLTATATHAPPPTTAATAPPPGPARPP